MFTEKIREEIQQEEEGDRELQEESKGIEPENPYESPDN